MWTKMQAVKFTDAARYTVKMTQYICLMFYYSNSQHFRRNCKNISSVKSKLNYYNSFINVSIMHTCLQAHMLELEMIHNRQPCFPRSLDCKLASGSSASAGYVSSSDCSQPPTQAVHNTMCMCCVYCQL